MTNSIIYMPFYLPLFALAFSTIMVVYRVCSAMKAQSLQPVALNANEMKNRKTRESEFVPSFRCRMPVCMITTTLIGAVLLSSSGITIMNGRKCLN